MKPPRLFFIRHGETEWSRSGRHTGRTDIALTDRGEKQAQGLMQSLTQIDFSRVLSSPRLRACQTCHFAGLSLNSEIEEDLAEWDFGDYEGLLSTDIRESLPDWDVWRDGSPGGETPAEVATRLDRLIARLNTMEGNIALFSHGQLGASFAARWIGRPLFEGRHFTLETASVSILSHDAIRPELQVISLWNSIPDARRFGRDQSLASR